MKGSSSSPARPLGSKKTGPGIVAALDVGTMQSVCLIARIDAQGQVRVLSHAIQASNGLRNAAIVDIDTAGHAVGTVVQAAEAKARQKVDRVIVNLSAGQVRSERVQTQVKLSDKAIGTAEVMQALADARTKMPADGRALLHFIPLAYAVDGARGVRDPRGLFGDLLELDALLVTAPAGVLRTLRTAVGRAHLEVADTVVSAYAAGMAVLHADERELGVTLIDLGAGSTNIAVFSEGEPVYCESIPIGGAHITNDIARGLSTPVAYAERLKTLHGSCLSSASDERDLIDLQPIGEAVDDESLQAPRSLLVTIIRARMEEIFEMVRRSAAGAETGCVAGGAVVLTGGGAQLHGVTELATEVLDKRVRIGRPRGVAGLGEMADSPNYSTAVGTLLFAQRKLTGGLGSAAVDLGGQTSILERLGAVLKIGR